MNMDQICILAVWFTNILILFVLGFGIFKINKKMKEKTDFEILKFNFEVHPDEKDFVILEQLIQDNLAMYRILKLETMDKLYITDQIQNEIFEYVLRETMYQISPIYLQRLSYIYNKDKLNDIIVQKINLYIMQYRAEVNSAVLNKK